MHRALGQKLGDLGGREIGDVDARKVRNRSAVIAGAARLDEIEAGTREEGFRVLLQPALGGHGDDEGRAHGSPPQVLTPQAASRSIQAAKPTAGIGARLPSLVSSPS